LGLTNIRSIGTYNFGDQAYFDKVQSDFTIAAAKFCATSLAPKLPPGKNFRFVRISGTGSVQDQDKRLLLLAKARKLGVSAPTNFTKLSIDVHVRAAWS